MNKNISGIAVALLLFIILPVLSAAGCAVREDDEDLSYDLQSLEPVSEEPAEPIISQESIFVYVCGQVEKPGVYEVASEARIYEVLKMAGGVRKDADISAINQARKLSDGEQIYVPKTGEAEGAAGNPAAAASADDSRVNINTADAAELMTLPGVGASRAEAIIAYREQSGQYRAIEDIMNVSGIKEGLFSKISDKIKVN